MEKKNASLPRMYKTSTIKEPLISFKVRPALESKDKQNKLQKSVLNAKAKNTINKLKNFDSPQLVFALNQSIRLQTSLTQQQLSRHQHIQSINLSKTFHSTFSPYRLQKLEHHPANKKYYAHNQERDKAISLSNWITDKLKSIKNKSMISLDDILQYNQTVVNYGLGEIIQTVRKRCKQQGQTLKMIWDNTFALFENLLNVLAEQLKKKDIQMIENEKRLEKIYLTNLSFINKKNEDLEKHLQLLYQKMKKVILWNRRLRKDRFKQQIQIRVRDYRLATYTSALQEAIGLLLVQSRQNCLKLAKKITSKLYRQKNIRNKGRKIKKLKQQAQSYMQENARQFVIAWLKRYSFQDQQKIQNAVFLSQDQKLEIMKITDQNQADYVDIYDFFQTNTIGTQTQSKTADKFVQYQQYLREYKTRTVGIGTKHVFKNTIGIQVVDQKIQKKKNEQPRQSSRALRQNKITKNKQFLLNKKSTEQQNILPNSVSNIKSKQLTEQSSLRKIRKLTKKQTGIQDQNSYNIQSQFEDFINDEELLQFGSQICIDYKNNEQQHKQQKSKEYKKLGSLKLISQYDEIPFQNSSNLSQKNIKVRNKNKMISQRYITEVQQTGFLNYIPKPLNMKKFEQAYNNQMKIQIQQNKEQVIRTVIRRRSFYKTSRTRQQKNEKQLIFLWYRPNKYTKQKRQFNQLDQNIYNYFSLLNKTLNLPFNYSKSKTFQQTCNLFSTVSTGLNNVPKAVPKNKQFINLSVNGITKFISRLLFDYLRKIRSDMQGVYIQSERVYYPLSVILVDHMMHKYGLKQIAQKKLKDFMEKVSNFVGISQRINFFYRLFGVGQQTMSADELIIYMKCLVYFDVGKTIPIMNVSKDFTVQRVVTDKQTVLTQVDILIKQFFRQNMRGQVKWKIQKYFHTYQLSGFFDIQRIAVLLIDQFVAIKKQQYQHYIPIYKNCQGNFFPNLLKMFQMFCSSQVIPLKYTRIVQQIFKNADLLDQIYGKSISELRFIGLCVKLGFPKFGQIKQKLKKLKNSILTAIDVDQEWSPQSEQILNKIKKKYNIKVSVEREAPDYWLFACAQIAYDIPLINAYSMLGNLKFIQNWKNSASN